jgi:lysophospholipase L1-like esterase
MPFGDRGVRAMIAARVTRLEPPAGLERAADGIHLTPTGSAAWARWIAAAFTR